MSEAQAATQHSLQPNAVIAERFRVEAILGQGGMGAVYRVHDDRHGRALALKQLRTDPERDAASTALIISQFEREYHTLCQLSHPSIIEVYDYGVDGGSVFYTMELLDGQDLRERGRLGWREACAVLRDVASSLAIMHSRRLLHRDISARNVRCTSTGRAKLIDFGAMTNMGLCKHVVGTAPFVPPEALQLQVLDGRADLYAVGVLAYWVLTGRHPYPARSFGELPNQWRNFPAPPRRYDAEIPDALDQLVMELIELDRGARPTSAAEVMERLSGIAGLPLRELPAVSRAYLVAPTLVGREKPLQAIRSALVQTLQGKGGSSFVIEGAEGTGRSRLLDACVLEAKLLGATVLRSDASDTEGGDYAVAKALCARLFEEQPQLAQRCARPWRSLLRRLLPEQLAVRRPSDGPITSSPPKLDSLPPAILVGSGYSMMPPAASAPLERDLEPAPEPRTLQAAVRDFVLSVARSKHLAIVVDDAESIDAPSAALLGALAHGAKRRRLTVLASLRTPAAPSPALTLLRELAQPLLLEPLTLAQCETLLSSVFGEAGRLPTLTERMFALAGGNPRWTMALCEHIVDSGLARYEAGSWRLPIELKSEDLPQSLAAASAARLAVLPSDARELALALSLSDPSTLPLHRYPLLTAHRDVSRVYRALDALVQSGVMLPQGDDRYRFAQQGTADSLREEIPADQQRELHGRLALAYEDAEDAPRVPYHLLRAGQDRKGLDRLAQLRHDVRMLRSKILLETMCSAAEAAERTGISQLRQLEIRAGLLAVAVGRADYDRVKQHAWPLLRRFARDSGLTDYEELDSSLEPEARLQDAQTRCMERYELAPERERGARPHDAALSLRMVVSSFVGMAATTQDLQWIEHLPSLEPLFPLVPSLRVTQLQVEFQRHMQAGRAHLAEASSRELLALLEQPDAGGLEPELAKGARSWELHNQGLFAAARGDRAALQWVAPIDAEPYYRASARRVRMAFELMHGNVEAANSLRRRAELFALEDGIASILPGTSTRLELIVYSNTDDVIGVKRTLERLETIAAHFPNWRPTCEIARSQYLRIQGDLPRALASLTSALTSMLPGRHIDWGLGASSHVALLTALERGDEAVSQGFEYLALSEQHQLEPSRFSLLRVQSEALTRVGRLDDSQRMIDEHLALCAQQQIHGLQLGLAYEARARIAIAAGDEDGVRRYAELCAQEYKGARNPMLSAKYKGLMREAEAAGLVVSSSMLHALGTGTRAMSGGISRVTQDADHTLSSRMLGCVDRQERAREGLRLLLESAGAAGGYLFETDDDNLQLLAAVEEAPPAPELLRMLQSRASTEIDSSDVATSFEVAASEEPAVTFKDRAGRVYEPMSLASQRDDQPGLLAMLRYDSPDRTVVRRDLLDALVEALADA